MLFAAIDYVQYRTQRGIYAPSAIRNGILLTPDNFPEPFHFQAGDLFFVHTRISFLSWLVMYLTNSPWSHTGLFSDTDSVIEATTSGVVEHPFSDYLDGQSYIAIYRPPYPPGGAEKAVAYSRVRLGVPFNWPGVVRLGLRILVGKDAHYRYKLSVDILLVLALLSLPAVRWRIWLSFTSTMALAYIWEVARSRPIREEMQRAMQSGHEAATTT